MFISIFAIQSQSSSLDGLPSWLVSFIHLLFGNTTHLEYIVPAYAIGVILLLSLLLWPFYARKKLIKKIKLRAVLSKPVVRARNH